VDSAPEPNLIWMGKADDGAGWHWGVQYEQRDRKQSGFVPSLDEAMRAVSEAVQNGRGSDG
jgi:hypothetical protein